MRAERSSEIATAFDSGFDTTPMSMELKIGECQREWAANELRSISLSQHYAFATFAPTGC